MNTAAIYKRKVGRSILHSTESRRETGAARPRCESDFGASFPTTRALSVLLVSSTAAVLGLILWRHDILVLQRVKSI